MNLERDLVNRAKNGDVDAFEALVEGYEKKIYNTAYRFFYNREDAFDITQEIFIKIYTSLSKFREGSSFSTWIYRIAVNTCIDFYRKRKEHTLPINDEIAVADEGRTHMVSPEEAAEKLELKEEIQKAISLLSEEQRISVILRDIQGFSYMEISEILNCTLGTVKSRINRGRKALKDILQDFGTFKGE